MPKTAQKSNPELWKRVKAKLTRGAKGGRSGQWSARKAQMAVQEYKRAGGGYSQPRSSDNHLTQWTKEKWGTRSGKPSRETGERYLPTKARAHLSSREYATTTAKKRKDTAQGRQFSPQPKAVARKTAAYRHHEKPASHTGTVAELYAKARAAGIPGRSRMNKSELQRALRRSRA